MMKIPTIKNSLSYLFITILSLFSGVVSAHSGHGDHAVIYASGQPHPVFGLEHVLLLSLAVTAVYLAIRQIRK